MSLYTSLSGLNAAQASLSVTSNNIANAGTLGFRRSRAEFGDLFNISPNTVGSRQIGVGVQLNRVAHLFSQGAIQQTGSALDLAISGQGFFAVAPQNSDGMTAYTRAGAFGIAGDGYIRNSAGHALLFYPTADDGSPLGQTEALAAPLQVPGSSGQAQMTTQSQISLRLPNDPENRGMQDAVPPTNAFDPNDPTSYAFSKQVPVFDENGAQQEARLYVIRSADGTVEGDTAQYRTILVVDGDVMEADPSTLSFDADGVMSGDTELTFSGATRSIAVDFAGSNMADQPFSIASATHNGTTQGALVSLEVDSTGVLWSGYSNGERRALGQVAMADFANPSQMRQIGNATYIATEPSGSARFGSAATEGFGNLQSASLERSNVDLTSELVDLITAQRNYQASAKAMETSSSLLQTIMNIRS